MICESPLKPLLLIWTLSVCATSLPLIGQEAGASDEPATTQKTAPLEQATDALEAQDSSALRAKAQAHFAAGITFEAQGNLEKALESFELALKADPSNGKLAYQVAEKYVALQKFEEAYQTLLPATEQDDAEGKAFQLLGLIQMARGEEVVSFKSFKSALEKDPSLILSRQRLVDVHLQNQAVDAAFGLVREAVKVTNYELEDITALIGLYLKFIAVRPDRLEDLAPQLESLVVKSSEIAEDHPALGVPISDILMLMNRFEDAEKKLKALKQIQPPLPMVREKLVDLFLRQNKSDAATQELIELTELNPKNPRPHLLLGSLKADQGEEEAAEKHYRQAIEIQPEFEAPYYELAALKLNGGNAREALGVLQQARVYFSKKFILEYYSGLAMSTLHRYDAALRFFRTAEEIAEKSEPQRLTGFFYFRIGATLERLGKLKEAETEFLRCLSKTPEDATALNYLGYMWAEHGEKLDQAYKWIEQALELEPESEAILDSMGWVLFKQGKPEAALPFLEKAEQMLKEVDPTILDHLGDVYHALDLKKKAEKAYRQSLEIEFNEKVFEKWQSLSEPQDAQS